MKASVDKPLTTAVLRQMSIEYRPIEELKPDPANPRLHSKKQIRQIAKSIETFGFNVPVLVDAELNVIAGHGRILAASALGMTQVPIVCLDHLTPAQIRAFMIADNRLTENRDLGRPSAGRAAARSVAQRSRFRHRGHRLRDGRDRSADRLA